MKDIEIYLREPVIKRVVGWLKSELGELEEVSSSASYRRFLAVDYTPAIPISININVEKTVFTAVWIDSSESPWGSDIECAKSAYAAFSIPVLCDPGSLSDHMDDFYRIDDEGERVVRLKDGSLRGQ